MKKVGKQKALFIAKKVKTSLVFNMAKLEGNPYTFPEVQTLLDGITVGGHKLSDQDQVLRISAGWDRLIQLVEKESFSLDKQTAIEINALVARGEALSVGTFRDGMVSISGTNHRPPSPDKLEMIFDQLVDVTEKDPMPTAAFRLFLRCSANQFFWDGNRRTAQLLMNGLLVSHEYMPVSIPAQDQLEYYEKMIRFYDTGDTDEMEQFLSQCMAWPEG
ncbi:Fic family protein [Sedimenticola selenatireducens]|uniref:Fic family protein n=1 Tax=Sedimenticola selenatireducens TaxID=191960 RepID=UPI002AAB49D2|nr:Fic family protein [Sedimenticola selenatireducens]